MKGNRDGIAEAIENNVRTKIIKEHLNDPAFYEKMSALLDEIIANRKRKALDYELYLKEVADLVRRVEAGHADDMPPELTTPGRRALYNNLKLLLAHEPPMEARDALGTEDPVLDVALRVDEAVRLARHDGWRGVQTKEQSVKAAIYNVLKNIEATERTFLIVKHQQEY
jgi:type I restriction enzyme R subunit